MNISADLNNYIAAALFNLITENPSLLPQEYSELYIPRQFSDEFMHWTQTFDVNNIENYHTTVTNDDIEVQNVWPERIYYSTIPLPADAEPETLAETYISRVKLLWNSHTIL